MVRQFLDVSPGSADDDRRGIARELKRGSLELIVLHLLSLGEAYGYEIVYDVDRRGPMASLEVTDGTLYPVLYRLERGGFVDVRWETPQRGVPRKYRPPHQRRGGRAGPSVPRVEHLRERDGPASSPATGDNMSV